MKLNLRLLACALTLITVVYADCVVNYVDYKYRCDLECSNVGWNDGIHPGNAAGILASQLNVLCGPSVYYSLQFRNCSFPDQRLDEHWFTSDPTPKFSEFFIEGSDLATIDDGVIALYESFAESLIKISISESPNLSGISVGMFEGALSSSFRDFEWMNNGDIATVDFQLFSDIADSIETLYIGICGLPNVQSLANITGISQPETLANLRVLSYADFGSGQGINVFSKDLISAINSSHLFMVNFYDAEIETFEDNTALEPLAAQPNDLIYLNLAANKLKTIPNGLFDPLLSLNQVITIYLDDNPWHCDENLEYLQNLLNDYLDELEFDIGGITCATPYSQAGKRVIDADLTHIY